MKDNLKNLFIVGTPLQVINAIEALKHFKLENNILVIVHRSLEANKVQMDALKGSYKWEEIIDIEYSRHSSMLKYVNLVKYLKKYTFKYVFISKLEVVPKVVIPNIKKEKVFLLDDGALTITIYEKQIKPNKINKYNFKELRFLFFGLKIKIKDKINLFSYYDLTPVNGIEVVKNELNFLKESHLKNAKKDDETIYFIGQPIYDLIGVDTYIENLEKIIKKNNNNKKIIYIPHRVENKEILSRLTSICNSFFTIREIGMPVELYFLQNCIYPSHVISYYSTALTTVALIYSECEVNPIKIPEHLITDKYVDNTLKVYYRHFDKDKVILFEDL